MTVYLVNPRHYGGGVRAQEAFALLQPILAGFVDVNLLDTTNAVWSANPGSADALVLANPLDSQMPEEFVELIDKAVRNGAVVIPVAGEVDRRTPPAGLDAVQSFDVVDRLRLRAQPESALTAVASDLARNILSRVSPTLMKDRLRLFLCHRRADGESLAAAVDAALSKRHEEHVFRDLIEVQVGEVAQDVIDQALEDADVVVFLDTPRAGESEWVAKELRIALGRQIPIVWVRLGADDQRAPLPVAPAGTPHVIDDADDLTPAHADQLADQVIQVSSDLAAENIGTANRTFSRVRRAARAKGMTVDVLDQRRLIYALTDGVDRELNGFPRRPHSDIVQVFGRHPTKDDQDGLVGWLDENGYGPHDRSCRAFDAAVLLDPLTRSLILDDANSIVVAHMPNYLSRLEPVGEPAAVDRTLLLLGAFPDEAGAQEPVKQAVSAVVQEWLARGGQVAFGGHPTFTPMIVEIAARLDVDSQRSLTIFQSSFYVSEAFAEILATQASVELVRAGQDRDESLTLMRNRMIEARDYDVVVAIGGRTSEGGNHSPGIDEEIALARARGLGTVLIGGPGGRAAELADAARGTQRPDDDPRFSTEQVEWLATTDDYNAVVEMLWTASPS